MKDTVPGSGRSRAWTSPTACCAARAQPSILAIRAGDELLTALLLAVFVRQDGATSRTEMPLQDVLDACVTGSAS